MGQAQRDWGEQQGRWRGVALAGEDVDDDRRGMDAVIERFAAGSLDSLKAVLRHAGQDLDHLDWSLAYTAQMLSRYAAIDPDMTDGILDKVLSAELRRAALAAPAQVEGGE